MSKIRKTVITSGRYIYRLVAENSSVNDVSKMYQDTVREDGQFESWDLFIDYIFETLPIGVQAIKRVYQEFMEAKIRMSTIASVLLNGYKRKFRRLYLIQELAQVSSNPHPEFIQDDPG